MTPTPNESNDYNITEKEINWWDRPERRHTVMGDFGAPNEDGPSYSPTIRMDSRIESYVTYERVSRWDIDTVGSHSAFEHVQQRMEHGLRRNLSFYGLLIEDSMEFTWERGEDFVECSLSVRAICPTLPPDYKKSDATPKRYHCRFCETHSFEDIFHAGACGNCGAPQDRR